MNVSLFGGLSIGFRECLFFNGYHHSSHILITTINMTFQNKFGFSCNFSITFESHQIKRIHFVCLLECNDTVTTIIYFSQFSIFQQGKHIYINSPHGRPLNLSRCADNSINIKKEKEIQKRRKKILHAAETEYLDFCRQQH